MPNDKPMVAKLVPACAVGFLLWSAWIGYQSLERGISTLYLGALLALVGAGLLKRYSPAITAGLVISLFVVITHLALTFTRARRLVEVDYGGPVPGFDIVVSWVLFLFCVFSLIVLVANKYGRALKVF